MTSFGAFIDLGGVDGLVHVTELSHERNVSPKSVVSVGDEVEVKVLAIDEEAGRVSLSLKATTPGPWDGVEQKLAAGDVIEGKVKRLTDFGAFVEVLPGIDGLVHISQISHKRVENPKDVLSVGQDVTVKVLEVNADAERVSLSIKALEERPAKLKAKTTKNVNHVHVVQNVKKNVTTNFQKLNLDSQWRIFSEISNCKIKKEAWKHVFFSILEYAIIVYC